MIYSLVYKQIIFRVLCTCYLNIHTDPGFTQSLDIHTDPGFTKGHAIHTDPGFT